MKNNKNTPFENAIADKYEVQQMKRKDLQERITRQGQKEYLMVTIRGNAQTEVMCRLEDVDAVCRKYGI